MSTRGARTMSVSMMIVAGFAMLLALTATARAQDEPAPTAARQTGADAKAEPKAEEKPQPPAEIKVLTVEDMLRKQIEELRKENQTLREQLARAELDSAQAQRERDELQQYIDDHDQYGADFEKYQGMLEIAEREQRMQRAEEHREKLRQQEAERKERYEQAKAIRAAKQAEQDRLRRYERAGFYPVGKEVYVSAMAYQYKSEDVPDTSYRFAPLIRFDGSYFFTRYWQIDFDNKIDFTSMTFSGSVLNSADEPRNIGIAITFFDGNGNQVGGESIEIENARTDAPYPFTHTLDMALNRPFSSYRVIVLYSDPVTSDDKSASLDADAGDVIGHAAATKIATAD